MLPTYIIFRLPGSTHAFAVGPARTGNRLPNSAPLGVEIPPRFSLPHFFRNTIIITARRAII